MINGNPMQFIILWILEKMSLHILQSNVYTSNTLNPLRYGAAAGKKWNNFTKKKFHKMKSRNIYYGKNWLFSINK